MGKYAQGSVMIPRSQNINTVAGSRRNPDRFIFLKSALGNECKYVIPSSDLAHQDGVNHRF